MKFALAASMLSAASAFDAADEHLPKFLEFVEEYARDYGSEAEFDTRFSIFKENLERIDEQNALNPMATFGVNEFADVSADEFSARYLNAEPRSQEEKERRVLDINGTDFAAGGTVDWRGSNLLTPVKNQGQCGSCWAFSATEAVETGVALSTGKLWTLAPQQVTSCDRTSFGCNGGTTESAYRYIESNGGLQEESSYPYVSGVTRQSGTCKSSSSEIVASISGFTSVSSSAAGESKMVTEIATSPISICVDAETWSSYTGGVVSVCGQQVDHCVQAVGYEANGVEDEDGNTTPYWIVRNSWGTRWGESGYIYVKAGSNTCAIASDATIVTV